MENKKAESNIFSSVVAEPAINPEANTVLLQFVILVAPIIDSDVKWCGLNQ